MGRIILKYFLLLISVIFHSCHPNQTLQFDEALFNTQTSISLFSGESLGSWQPTDFPNAGKVHVKDSSIILPRGGYLTGITWNGPILKTNYELELDAKRVEGHDFFCGITFPFEETYASLILGGWGGYTTGISNIDGIDASENGTADVIIFEDNVWYHVRLRITSNKIEAWVDDQNIVDLDTTGKVIGLRSDVDITTPLSILTFNTSGVVKNIVLKKL